MTPPDARPDDPRFDELLASCHEALMADRPLPTGEAVPPELAGRLQRDLECLRRLERARRRPPPGGELAFAPSSGQVTRIDRFELRRELGRGGHGIVFLAWDPRMRREVALKIPHIKNLLHPELRQRFLREARAAALLDHPNIVPVYEAGEAGTDWYIASAYCEGLSLAEWLAWEAAPVPPRQAAALVAALADAVQYVHDRKVLHRDIKPSNVLLQWHGPAAAEEAPAAGPACTLGGMRCTPRLTDFGLAKLLDSDTHHTRTGALLGTPSYMAPEQAEGRLADVGPATDIHALGAVLYELLTGRPPFRGQSDMETLRLVSAAEPVPPRHLRRDVPRPLQTLCLKCLEKEPRGRFASAGELAAELRRYLAGERLQTPLWDWTRTLKWLRRRSSLPLLATFVLALTFVLLAVLYPARGQPGEKPARAEEGGRSPSYVETIYAAGRKLADGSLNEAAELLERLRPRPGVPDRRGFEWSCLKRLCQQQQPPDVTVLRNPLGVYSLARSPDGRTLAWGHAGGGGVVFYDVATGAVSAPLPTDAKVVNALAFSPDGKVLAAGGGPYEGGQYTVTLWDVATRVKCGDLAGSAPSVNRLAFSPDGKWLAVGTSRGTDPAPVALWDWESRPVRRFYLHDNRGDQDTTALAFSPDGRHLVTGQTWLVVWDMADVKGRIAAGRVDERGVLREPTGWKARDLAGREGNPEFWDVAFRDSLIAATACSEKKVELISLRMRPRCVAVGIGEHRVRAYSVAFSPDGTLLASGGGEVPGTDKNSEVKIWGAESGCELATFEGHTGPVRGVAFIRDGRTLVTGSEDGTVRLWGLTRLPKRPAQPPAQYTEVWSVAYSPDGRTLATAGDDGLLKLWDAATGKELATLREGGPAGAATPLLPRAVFSPDGQTLAAGDYDGFVRLWDVSTRRLLWKRQGHGKLIHDLAFSPDGKLLATGSRDNSAKLWDAATGQERHALKGHALEVNSVAFAPDGKVLVTAGEDRTLRFWDVATGEAVRQLKGAGPIRCVAFSPDGGTLAWAGNAGVIHRWDVATEQEREPMGGHTGMIRSLAFAPDGRTLASCSEDRTVRLWCPVTGREFLTLRGHNERVYGVAFDPQGKTLASVCHDGTVRLWRGDPEGAER